VERPSHSSPRNYGWIYLYQYRERMDVMGGKERRELIIIEATFVKKIINNILYFCGRQQLRR